MTNTKQINTDRDENGFEIETETSEHKAEIKRIQESGERLNYSSAGAVRRLK